MRYARGAVILYEDLCEHWLRWAREAGLTTLGVHKIAPAGTHGAVQALLDSLAAPRGRKYIDLLENAGIAIEYELHSLEWLLPRELLEKNPELFRMNENGERTNDNNFCPSNPLAREIIAQRAWELAKQLRQSGHNYYLWPDDTSNAMCRCPACQAAGMGGAELGMTFSNAVAEGVRAYDSQACASYIAYSDAKVMPKRKPAKNVFLEFAPMDRDYNKPLSDPSDPRGTEYIRLLSELLTLFPPETTHVLEYWMDNALYSGYKKPPVKVPFNASVMDADVKMYTGFGIRNVKSFCSYIDQQYYALYSDPPMAEYGEILKKYIP